MRVVLLILSRQIRKTDPEFKVQKRRCLGQRLWNSMNKAIAYSGVTLSA
jgi:hypothetical protein